MTQPVLRIAIITALVSVLAGCASLRVPPPPSPGEIARNTRELFRDPRSQETQSWQEVREFTQVIPVGNDRLRIEARGGALAGGERVDLRLLVRASAETLERGYTHFAIVHIRDDNRLIGGALGSQPVYGAETVWIGNYEELVASRYERDYGPGPWNWVDPVAIAVVLMMHEDDRRATRAFDASGVYRTLLVDHDL